MPRDGKDALRVLGDVRALPSAVLLDLAMPVMGGDELVPVLARDYRRGAGRPEPGVAGSRGHETSILGGAA